MRRFLLLLALAAVMTAGAQDAKELYQRGKELCDAKDYEHAFPLLKTAAEKGHRKAQYRLGRCYDKGRGVAGDDSTAFYWYSKSAEQGYAKAQYQVGECYKEGTGVAKDRKKAFAWHMKAARQDHAEAQYRVGKSFLSGKGTTADPKKARSWLSKAVKNPKGGAGILTKLRKKAAAGDEDAASVLQLIE